MSPPKLRQMRGWFSPLVERNRQCRHRPTSEARAVFPAAWPGTPASTSRNCVSQECYLLLLGLAPRPSMASTSRPLLHRQFGSLARVSHRAGRCTARQFVVHHPIDHSSHASWCKSKLTWCSSGHDSDDQTRHQGDPRRRSNGPLSPLDGANRRRALAIGSFLRASSITL